MKTQYAWAAGMFDGEGCVVIRKPSASVRAFVVQLSVEGIHRPGIEHFARIAGVGTVHPDRYSTKKGRQKWVWQAAARKAEKVLRAMLPYLIIKRKEVELALEFLSLPLIHRGRGGKRTTQETAARMGFHRRLQELKRYEFTPGTQILQRPD